MKTTSPRFFLCLLLLVGALGAWVFASSASAQESNWIQKAPANSPTGRYLSGMANDMARGEVVLFGGRDNSNRNDTWVWDGTTWTQKNPLNSPTPRQVSGAMAYDVARSEVVLFGGYDGGLLNDTWVWDGVNWTQKHPQNSPTPRAYFAMAYDADRGQVVLFGGNGSGLLNDTWVWDGTNWTQKNPSNSPTPRYRQAMAYDSARRQMVLFGGNDGTYPGDTWVWDGTNWMQKSPSNSPTPRVLHAMAYDAGRRQAVLFGGYDGSLRKDTWVWDGANWTQMSPLTSPTPRQLEAMTYDNAHGQVILFGGSPSLPSVLGDTWVFSVAPSVPFPPQKIFLAFGQPSSFSLIVPTVFGKAWPIVNPFGSFDAAAISESYRNSVTSQLKTIYSRSGIHNIEWTTTDSDDAIAVYFCPAVNPDLLGYSKGPPDRFNSTRRGEVIVFVNESFPLANLDAESAAHEIGHALGLRHVNPPAGADPTDEEVMDLDFSSSPEFINAVSDVTDITSFSTHNPLYHLHRYVDGWSSAQLQNAGISPGTWDNGSTISTRFSFQNENLRLYNITVFASGGSAESSFALEQISSATLAELSGRSFAVPEGLGIVLLASSTTNGQPDVISSTGDAFSATNQVIAPSGTNTFSLFRQDSPTNAVVVSTATAEFDAQSPHCNIFVSAPGVFRLDFRGTLQSSTTLTNWTDVGAVSPHFIAVGSTNTAEFFRSRQ